MSELEHKAGRVQLAAGSGLSDRLDADAERSIKMHQYSHPSWDVLLVVLPGDDSAALEILDEDDDGTDLQMVEVKMTKKEFDALPKFHE